VRALLLAALLAQDTAKPLGATVALEFVVTAPATTPADATLWLAGNLDVLGAWKPHGVKLVRGEDGLHRARVNVPRGAELEFKVTRGSWALVERAADGADVENRRHEALAPATIEVAVAAWSEGRASTIVGVVERHEGFGEKSGLAPRAIHVWLPPGCTEPDAPRCSVLYMHDGQNLFDAAGGFGAGEWRVDETCDRLIRAGAIPPLIVVGIANTRERMSEYTPSPSSLSSVGGHAGDYARLLLEEVKPFVDARYPTRKDRDHTFVAGSSLGGLVSLVLAQQHPEVFGGAAALSPVLTWDREWIRRKWEEAPPSPRVRLWIDMGTKEGEGRVRADDEARARTEEWLGAMQRFAATLEKSGMQRDVDFAARVIEGARHHEAAWAARFEEVLRFLLGPASEETVVRRELAAYYRDLSARDWKVFADHFWPGASITTAWQPPGEEKVRVVPSTVEEFVRLAPQGPDSKPIFEERMVDATITVEGSLAQAWVHYVMRFGEPGDVLEFAGIDSISLLRQEGRWRIASLVFAGQEDPTGK